MKKKVKRVQMRYEIIFSAHGSFIVSYCWRLSFCFVKLGCRNMNRLIEDIKIAHLAQLLIIILCTHVLTLHREMSLVSLGKPTCIKITLQLHCFDLQTNVIMINHWRKMDCQVLMAFCILIIYYYLLLYYLFVSVS